MDVWTSWWMFGFGSVWIWWTFGFVILVVWRGVLMGARRTDVGARRAPQTLPNIETDSTTDKRSQISGGFASRTSRASGAICGGFDSGTSRAERGLCFAHILRTTLSGPRHDLLDDASWRRCTLRWKHSHQIGDDALCCAEKGLFRSRERECLLHSKNFCVR